MERQFTRQAENALKLATTIAKSCGHGYIGTEHLLAGLLKEPEGTAGKVLQEFNVEEEKLRELISSLVTPVQGNTAAAETKGKAPGALISGAFLLLRCALNFRRSGCRG